jgi:putative endonuclease
MPAVLGRHLFSHNMKKQPCVYLLANKPHEVLYVGVTSNILARCWQHKTTATEGFTKNYHAHCLVYYELHATMEAAIYKEKQLKKWKRAWKIRLLEINNPAWRDLWNDII